MSNRKQDILKRARKFFSEKSIHKVSLEEISRSLGMGKSTMYHYFSTKKELISEVLKETVSDFYKFIYSNVDRNASYKVQLKCLVFSILQYFEKNEDVFLLISRERLDYLDLEDIKNQFNINFKPEYEKFMENFYEVIESGKRDGIFVNINSSIIVANIFGTINAVTLYSIYHRKEVNLNELADECYLVITKGICS